MRVMVEESHVEDVEVISCYVQYQFHSFSTVPNTTGRKLMWINISFAAFRIKLVCNMFITFCIWRLHITSKYMII